MNKYADIASFKADLNAEQVAQVELLREIVRGAHAGLTEHIKWNAPSYVLDGEDRVTFNLQNKAGQVKLVLHMGATRTENKTAPPLLSDESGLVEWLSDIRGILSFADLADVQSKRVAVTDIVKRWLTL